MLREISLLAKTPIKEIEQNENGIAFSKYEIEEAFKLIKDKKNAPEIVDAIELKMIPFYHDLAVKNATTEEVDLNHIQK